MLNGSSPSTFPAFGWSARYASREATSEGAAPTVAQRSPQRSFVDIGARIERSPQCPLTQCAKCPLNKLQAAWGGATSLSSITTPEGAGRRATCRGRSISIRQSSPRSSFPQTETRRSSSTAQALADTRATPARRARKSWGIRTSSSCRLGSPVGKRPESEWSQLSSSAIAREPAEVPRCSAMYMIEGKRERWVDR